MANPGALELSSPDVLAKSRFENHDDSGLKVKFDLRFIVLLRSAQPLQLFLFKGFWLRFALNEFVLDSPVVNLEVKGPGENNLKEIAESELVVDFKANI